MFSRLAVTLLCLVASATALAQSSPPLQVISFAGGSNWPIWVAQEKGMFAANGVAVKLTATPNSVYQIRSLMSGKFDIGMSGFDNIVAYEEGQGETNLQTAPDLFAFMGGISGVLRLMASPDIKSYADLKGKTLGVDAATTGYAFIMYKLLEMHGLPAGDYKIAKAGGTFSRVKAMIKGDIAATMVNVPFDMVLEAKGFRRLGDTTETFGPYQASIGVARRSWAAKNQDRLVGFIRAYIAATDWLYDPANRAEAVAIYQQNIKNATHQIAEKSYDIMFSGKEGFDRKAKIDLEGMRTVLKIRSEFAQPKKELSNPGKYVDEQYYERALKP